MSRDDTQRLDLERMCGDALQPLQLAIYDIAVSGSGRARTVRVNIERLDGQPIDLETIASASRTLDPILDAFPGLAGAYTLEVSSPGLERPLRRPEHFARARGVMVTAKLDGERVRGVLTNADDDGFELNVDGSTRRIAYADASQVRTIFEWGASGDRKAATTRPRKEKAS
jgi:ribosome maturation factor RimP